METEMLEQVALDDAKAESVWREMMELSTEAAVLLYLAPSDMPEDEPVEGGILSTEEALDKEYETEEEKYGRSRLGEDQPEQEEEKSLYEKEPEKRVSEEEPNENNEEIKGYEK